MKDILLSIQLISGAVLTVVILIQAGGKGFARGWGGASSFTRRGLEKVVFRLTFVVAFVFIAISILQIVL